MSATCALLVREKSKYFLSKSKKSAFAGSSIIEKINIFKLHNGLTRNESFKSNMLMLLLYKILKQTDEYNLLAKMEDSSFCSNGHPFINVDDKKISHDKINSLLQLSEINRFKIIAIAKTAPNIAKPYQ